MINDWNIIVSEIKNAKNPLKLLLLLFNNKKMISDEDMSIIIRYFMNYHLNIFVKQNITKYFHLIDDYTSSKDIILDFYVNVKKQILITFKLNKFKLSYNRLYFWSKDIDDKIEYLIRLKDKLNSINDCSIGNISFTRRLIQLNNYKSYDKNINESELIYRIKLLYKLFGSKFFKIYNIETININEFISINLEYKVKYFEYLFELLVININKIIDNFTLYNCINNHLLSIINPKKINIEVEHIDTDIDIDF